MIEFLLLIIVLSCGKEEVLRGKAQAVSPQRQRPEVEKQQVLCEKNASCPSYLSKIMVIVDGERKFCTGTLVDPTTIVTSTSCLPLHLRSHNLDCSKEVFFFFAKSGKTESVGCKKVLQVSNLEGNSSMLWRDDVAFLEMSKPLYHRRQLAISREGLNENQDLTYSTIEQVDEFVSYIRRSECRPVFNGYVNPLSSHESSPKVDVAGCDFKNSSTGSPLTDSRGRVRAIISQNMSEVLRTYLINSGLLFGSPLQSIIHSSSFACAPTVFDDYVLDGKECAKTLSMAEVDNKRSQMMEPNILFAKSLNKVKKDISPNEFMQFEIRLIPFESYWQPEISPLCFKNSSYWIRRIRGHTEYFFTVKAKKLILKKMIDTEGKVQAQQTATEMKTHKIYFNPKNFYNFKNSTVTMIDANGKTVYQKIMKCAE